MKKGTFFFKKRSFLKKLSYFCKTLIFGSPRHENNGYFSRANINHKNEMTTWPKCQRKP